MIYSIFVQNQSVPLGPSCTHRRRTWYGLYCAMVLSWETCMMRNPMVRIAPTRRSRRTVSQVGNRTDSRPSFLSLRRSAAVRVWPNNAITPRTQTTQQHRVRTNHTVQRKGPSQGQGESWPVRREKVDHRQRISRGRQAFAAQRPLAAPTSANSGTF